MNNEMERAASLTIGNRVELSDLSTRIVPDEVRCHLLETEPLISGMGQIPLGRKRQRRRTTTCKKWSANSSLMC